VKRELLWSPSLDVIGNRLCNAFVLRDGTDTARELWRLRGMATGIGTGDGLVIIPEGTLYDEETRARARDDVGRVDRARAARFGELRHVLPPRRATPPHPPPALPEADVVVWRTRASRASQRSVRCCGRIWWDVGLRWLRGGFDVRRCPRVLRRGSIGGWASIERGRRATVECWGGNSRRQCW